MNLKSDQFNPYYNPGWGEECNVSFFILKTVCLMTISAKDSILILFIQGRFPVVAENNDLFSKALQLGMFGRELTDKELLEDSKEKAPGKPLTFMEKMRMLMTTLNILASAKKKVKLAKKAKVEFNIDTEKATSNQLFDGLSQHIDKFLPSYFGHMTATMSSTMYNGILYSFLVTKLRNADGKFSKNRIQLKISFF